MGLLGDVIALEVRLTDTLVCARREALMRKRKADAPEPMACVDIILAEHQGRQRPPDDACVPCRVMWHARHLRGELQKLA